MSCTPIPKGDYFIVDLPPDKAQEDWYGLYAADGIFNDSTGFGMIFGNMFGGKTGMRLHPGGNITGCVTVPKTANAKEWEKIKSMLEKTKTRLGPAKKGEKNRIIYGFLTVE